MKQKKFLSALLLIVFLAACNKTIEIQKLINTSASARAIDAATDLRVLQFNVWQEGTSVSNGIEKIANIIIATNADVVSLVEVRNYSGDWITKIKNELQKKGYHYYGNFVNGTSVGLISKYDVTESSKINSSIAAYTLNIQGRNIVVCAAHLDYTQYALYLPRGYNGGTPDWNMIDDNNDGKPDPVTNSNAIAKYNLASQRDESIKDFLRWAKNKTEPLILCGDFNEASCLDWTNATKNLYDHNGVVFEWQSTQALQDASFIDSYRQVNPDEKTHPGITWPSFANGVSHTNWITKSDERDRIDFIFFKGNGIYTKSAAVAGPAKSYVKNKVVKEKTSDTFIASGLPWPSDHKGVLSVLHIPRDFEK